MDKKGMEETFKYILIAVAGAIILIFFINFARQQIFLKEELNSAVLSRTLNSNFDSFSVSSNADKTIDLNEDVKIRFTCGKVQVNNVNPVNNENIIFSQRDIEGEKLNIWTAKWRMPFPVTNFFYVSGDTKIVIEGTDSLAKNLRGEINNVEFIPKRFVSSGDKIKRVIVVQDINQIGNGVVIYGYKDCDDLTDNYKCRGMVKFPDGEGIFIGKEMLYGAIFSDSLEDYKCDVNKAFERLTRVSDIYQEKANTLASVCSGQGSFGSGLMTGLSNGLNGLKNLKLENLNLNDVDAKMSKIDQLIDSNKEARGDCGIYLF